LLPQLIEFVLKIKNDSKSLIAPDVGLNEIPNENTFSFFFLLIIQKKWKKFFNIFFLQKINWFK